MRRLGKLCRQLSAYERPPQIRRNYCAHTADPLIINGRKLAEDVLQSVAKHVSHFEHVYHRAPGLAVILVQHRSDSLLYTQLKSKKAAELGIKSFDFYLEARSATKHSLIELIQRLNADNAVDGILLQLPLPPSLSEHTNDIVEHICPMKDVDGLTATNQGTLTKYGRARIAQNMHRIDFDCSTHCAKYVNFPCTPLAVLHILEYLERTDPERFRIASKNIVMVGRSALVGTPLSLMLCAKNATVTLCHSLTDDLDRHCRAADVIIVAVGSPNLITRASVSKGCVVIDVGTNVISIGTKKQRVLGDAAYSEIKELTSAITPVPGGVGPLTVAMLFANTIRAAKCRELNKSDKVRSAAQARL